MYRHVHDPATGWTVVDTYGNQVEGTTRDMTEAMRWAREWNEGIRSERKKPPPEDYNE